MIQITEELLGRAFGALRQLNDHEFGYAPWERKLRETSPGFWLFLHRKYESIQNEILRTKHVRGTPSRETQAREETESLRIILSLLLMPIYSALDCRLPHISGNAGDLAWDLPTLHDRTLRMADIDPAWAHTIPFLMRKFRLKESSRKLVYVVAHSLLNALEKDDKSQKRERLAPVLLHDPNRRLRTRNP